MARVGGNATGSDEGESTDRGEGTQVGAPPRWSTYWSVCLFLPPEPGQQVCLTKRQDFPTSRAGMIRGRGQDGGQDRGGLR